jgi:hypothetical protein
MTGFEPSVSQSRLAEESKDRFNGVVDPRE